jgi:signal transduction histidine kinase
MLRNRLQNGTTADFRVETRRRVMANPGRLLQVLLNLAGNAIDAMETTGGGTVSIRAEDVDENRVALVVADNGPGMTEAVHRRIFEPFFTTKPLGRGTGLGLHVVREIVTSQRGTVTCETKAGAGTTFRVELPAQPGDPETESDHVHGREDAADRGRRGDHPQGSGPDVSQGVVSPPACV